MSLPYFILPASGSDQADEWVRLGMEAQLASKLGDADRQYRNALRLDPRHAIATQNLGIIFAQQGNMVEAVLAIERAVIFDDKIALIHVNQALMNLNADHIGEAMTAATRALELCPTKKTVPPEEVNAYIGSRTVMAMLYATAGMPEKAIPLYNEVLDLDPKNIPAGPNVCFVQSLTDASPADLLWQRKRWADANRPAEARRPHNNDHNPDRVLRVGYVGGDFKRHSASMIFGNVLLHHDRAVVDPYFYSTLPVNPAADPMTKSFMDAAGSNWRDITQQTDEQAEATIRNDKIDILIDLAAHTAGGRLMLFARKPAPVQGTAWGFAHGTGVPEIDYFFADPVVLPASERLCYAEKIVDLPCVVTYLEPVEYQVKGVSALPYHKHNEEFITFGSYARYEKLGDKCLEVFAEILRRVPNSKLEFKDNAFRRPYSIRRVLAAMPDIDPSRILFSINTSHPDHLQAYQQADILLDPFPHCGGVVCLEQLYMGVPLITHYGSQPAGRTASSVLTLMNHPEWIAKTPEEYIEIAVKMTEDIPYLGKIRKVLRDELLQSPVVKGYREATENVYRQIWRDWCLR